LFGGGGKGGVMKLHRYCNQKKRFFITELEGDAKIPSLKVVFFKLDYPGLNLKTAWEPSGKQKGSPFLKYNFKYSGGRLYHYNEEDFLFKF